MSFYTKFITFIMSMILTVTGWVGKTPVHTLQINNHESFQTNEGFGTSAAWWAQNITDETQAEEIAKLLYDKEEGLGLEIFRFNVGAGEKENPASIVAVESRKAESFLVRDEATDEFVYDFTRDANAVRMMDLAVKYGAEKIILFCNSPHWTMTVNGLASGATEEGVCNLPPENYGAFVDYLLTIAEHFVEEGYPIWGISPINEPQWNWGTGWVSQEGCHYSPDETVALLECFATEMKNRKEPFRLLGPESGQMGVDSKEYEEKFFASDILREYCDTYSGHSYWLDGNLEEKRATGERFTNDYPGLKFEMSEWCELPQNLDPNTIDSAMRMANVIWEDLTLMNAVSWQSWTAVNGDGLLDLIDGELVQYRRYDTFRQFAMIPTGAVRIGVLDNHLDKSTLRTLAYRAGGTDYLVIVNNETEAKEIRLNGLYKNETVFVTSAEKHCEEVFNGKFTRHLSLPAQSITTILLSGEIC